MKYTLMSIVAIVALSTLGSANDLVDQAKKAGLEPIPSDKQALMKLIDNPKNPITDAKIELGKKLYFDPRLSKSGLISCNTCHNLGLGGTDGVGAAIGHKWTANPHHLNSPTVYNAVFMRSQFWDGRDPHLEQQAQGPMQAAPEMAISSELATQRISSMPGYVEAFKGVYSDGKITFERIADSIAVFERTLVTPGRYDAFLSGDSKALSAEEQSGLRVFIDKGCTSCHSGIALGGTMQPFPVVKPFKHANVGDFKGDKNSMVKVPTLRNINETAPYFHNGTVWDLAEAVKIMGETQLGVTLTEQEAVSMTAFLKALEGKKPDIVYPQLPVSQTGTPQPDSN